MNRQPLVPLGELVVANYGKALKKADRNSTGTTPVYGASGLIGRHDATLVDNTTIVIGRKGSVGSVTYAPEGGWVIDTAYFLQVMPGQKLDWRYLYWALSEAQLPQQAITTSIPGLNRNDFYRVRIPLPPLAEQRRIAGVLDRVEGVRGRYVKRNGWMKSLVAAQFIKQFGEPLVNPFGWPVLELGRCLADKPRIGTVRPAVADGTYPVVRVGELGSRTVSLAESKRVNLPPDELLRFEARSGDILVARAIGSESHLGKASILQETDQRVVFDSHIMRLRLDPMTLRPEYFWNLIQTLGGRSLLLRRGGRTAVQFNINAEQIATMRVPVPPMLLQDKFASLEQQLLLQQGLGAEAEAGVSGLRASLAHHFFGRSS